MNYSIYNSDSLKNKKEAFSAFLSSLYTTKSREWTSLSQKTLFSIFKSAVKETTAYPLFLEKSGVNSKGFKVYKDLHSVPPVGKKNYLKAYPWIDLCKNSALIKGGIVMTSTSGSTGEPFYFPRTSDIDIQSSVCHEIFLRSAKIPKDESILVVDCFGMGVWIGGLITYQAFKHVTERGRPLTIITPGINKQEIFQALRNLAPSFDNIILCGYPPFMKDVVDQAEDNGVIWYKYTVKIIFAAEGFSETFRDHIIKKVGIKNVYRDTANIYGSADLGTMAQETPLSILLRRLALKNKGLYVRLFEQATRLPTFAQFIPPFITFESIEGSVCCSGDNALPLFRYEIGDNGHVTSFDAIVEMCESSGINLKEEIKKAGIGDTIMELPFVSVYERTDFSTKLYGAIIYPEFIKKGIQTKEFSSHITSKFTMYTHHDDNHDEYLEVNIELQPTAKESKKLKEAITKAISKTLIEESAEHKNNTTLMPKEKIEPHVVFWSYGHEVHFKGGAKQKWVKK